MHQDDSPSSVATESLDQTGPTKLEKLLLVSAGYFVVIAGIVSLTHSIDFYNLCDVSLMVLLGIGWVIGCRKVAELEDQVAHSSRENRRLHTVQKEAVETAREREGRLAGILRNSQFMIGAVELSGDTVTNVYQNSAMERFFSGLLSPHSNQPNVDEAARTATIQEWIKRYQDQCWIKTPVCFDYEYLTEEGSRWLAVTVSQTGQTERQCRFCYVAEDISDKKKAQKSLAQNQEQLTEVLDIHPDTIFCLDSAWRVTYMNAGAIQTLGYGREVLGRVFWDLFPDMVGGEIWNEYSRAMADRVPVEFDIFQGSEDMRLQVRAIPCRGGLAVFLRNVTSERQTVDAFADHERQMSRRLAELEAQYRTAPMCLALFDRYLRFVRINQTMADLNGVRIEETLGRTLGDILPYSYDRIAPVLTEVLEAGEPRCSQFVNTKRSEHESWHHCLINAYPIHDEFGDVAGVSLMLLDTTAERQAERALRESEQHFRQLAEALPEIVWTADATGNIDYCNARWYSYTQCAGTDALTQWTSFIHPSDLEKWREFWNRSVHAREDHEIEYQFLRHDGVYRWFLCRAQAVLDSSGDIVKWFGTCTDIHHHKRMEHLLRRSNEDLKQLTAAATHDLQEHLRNVHSFCELARQHRKQLAAEANRCLETLLEATTPLNHRLEDLLAFSQVSPDAVLSLAPAEMGLITSDTAPPTKAEAFSTSV